MQFVIHCTRGAPKTAQEQFPWHIAYFLEIDVLCWVSKLLGN